jgi:hypothetical protein
LAKETDDTNDKLYATKETEAFRFSVYEHNNIFIMIRILLSVDRNSFRNSKLLLILVCACHFACNSARKNSDIHSISATVKIIKAFAGANESLHHSTGIITVSLKNRNDTILFHIMNNYPNIHELPFNLDTSIEGHRVIFAGERLKGYLGQKKINSYPTDIVNEFEHGESKYLDYRFWVFHIYNGKIVHYDPKNEIDKFLKINGDSVFQIGSNNLAQ